MRKSFPSKRKALAIAVMLAGTTLPALAQQSATVTDDDATVEEVLVTGSFIRGSPLDAPSPVVVVDRTSIEAQGAAIIWDVIKNLEINSGSITNPGSGDNSQVEGTANVNLRNLGENSTLTLINGRRQVSAAVNTRSGGELVDLNTIPLVMTDRIEVLTDGGSALYGADAVAGVVNIIMRTDFEGLEVYGDVQGISEASSAFDATVSAIWGWASDDGDTHFVLAGERFERDPVNILAGNFIDANSQFLGTVGTAGTLITTTSFGGRVSPGWINQEVTNRNIAEGGSSTTIYTDPGCYTQKSADGTPYIIGTLRQQRGEGSGTCREDVSEWTYLSQESTRNSIAGAFNHTFDNGVEFYSFAQYSENKTQRSDDGYNQSRGPTVFLAQPGAYVRSAAFGGNAIGQTLELGFFAPNVGLTRPTAADIPNVPSSGANGGPNVASYQGLRYGFPRVGSDDNLTTTDTTSIQTGLRGEFELAGRVLTYDVGATWGSSSLEQNYRTFARDRSELAANGLGGEGCVPNGRPDFNFSGQRTLGGAVPQAWQFYDPGLVQTFFPGFVFTTRESLSYALTSNNHGKGACKFYNPFLTAFSNPALANDPAMMEWINQEILVRDKRNRLLVYDAVVTGELMELQGGMGQFAVGGQYRKDNRHSRASEMNLPGLENRILTYNSAGVPNSFHYVSNNYDCSLCAFNYDHDRVVKAVFGELSLPLWENVETQFALRWEDYGGSIGDEISPKVAMSWRPIDTLLLRASWSESFRAPNIPIVFEGLEASGVTFRDPIRNQSVRAGLLPPTNENALNGFSYTKGGPAPNVGNEYADTYNIGFLWTPEGDLDGFSLGADFWRFEVSDRVLPQPPIDALQPEIAAFTVAAANPANYIYNDSIPASQTLYPTTYFPCSPAALEAQFGRESTQRLNCVVNPNVYLVDGIQRAFGVTNASLITLTLAAINAGTITSDGVDLTMGYRWSNDWGRFSASLDYTHVNQYELADIPGFDLGLMDIGVFDAAGTTGDGNLVRSLPDNKGHLTFNWQRDNHGVTVINRHIGSYKDLAYQATYETGSDFTRSLLEKDISSYQTWDIQYRYSHSWANTNLGTTVFTAGVLDLFNEELPFREAGSLDYDAGVFDGRGQRWYVRALWQFQ